MVKVPFAEWWDVLVTHRFDGLGGHFVHPACDPAVIAGNGTIGLEILEDLPEVDTVVVPYGGGGLSCGIACAIRASKPDTRVFAAEVDTAAPLAASLAAGVPTSIDYKASFEVSALRENLEALIGDLQKSKPSAAKGVYLQKITVSSTMGPGVPVDKASLGV